MAIGSPGGKRDEHQVLKKTIGITMHDSTTPNTCFENNKPTVEKTGGKEMNE